MKKNWLDIIALVLVIVGAVNWGIFGLFGLDLVDFFLGGFAWIAAAVYILVGLAGIYMIYYATR